VQTHAGRAALKRLADELVPSWTPRERVELYAIPESVWILAREDCARHLPDCDLEGIFISEVEKASLTEQGISTSISDLGSRLLQNDSE
jgi:hypothetical protein